jgi:hypothetical protein
VLGAGALLVHFLFGTVLPRFPGSQYLYAGATGELSLFPLFPWVAMAALGALAATSSAMACGALTVFFGLLAAADWWAEPGPDRLVKFPMDLAYAFLSCAAVATVFTLAHVLKRFGTATRALRWLGRRWLIFLYVHFAIAAALGTLRIGSAWLVWTLLGAGSIAATWLVARAAAPLARMFQVPAAWIVPLGVCAFAGAAPGLPPVAVTTLAGVAGLIFAAYHESLAYLVVNHPGLGQRSAAAPIGLGRGLMRVAVVAALLAVPELVGLVWRPAATVPARPAPPADENAPPQEEATERVPVAIPVRDL